jgi:hypothetical protein
MSADNGIYIAQFPDGYRVAYAMGIDNIDFYPAGTKERKEILKDYFGKSEVFPTISDAYKSAEDLLIAMSDIEDGFTYLEYGICSLSEVYDNWD